MLMYRGEVERAGWAPLTKVNYILSILQIYWKYTSNVYLKHTSTILEAYFKYTSGTLQVHFNLINYRR